MMEQNYYCNYTLNLSFAVQVGTVGVDFKPKTVMVNDEEVLVQVWDTAGQVSFIHFYVHFLVQMQTYKASKKTNRIELDLIFT